MDNQRNIATPAARKFVLSRGLPKTGQITSYVGGDDGDLQAGWWKGRLNANNKTRYRLVSISGGDVVMDRATGLMWPADGGKAGCNYGSNITWPLAIDYANGLTFAGFDDWRIPNVKELLSIVEYDAALYVGANPVIQEPPFSSTTRSNYWSATTHVAGATQALMVDFQNGLLTAAPKGLTMFIRCVRKGL